jgi:predicted N-acetyltransferase YhbS
MQIIIRPETENDYAKIAKVNELAFGQKNESLLIEKLRNTSDFIPELSLVAEYKNDVVGHILFYPVKINDGGVRHTSLVLAPMCVHPSHQSKGIGSSLVREGLKRAKDMGYSSVIVVGHPEYYPKFGFQKSSEYGIKAPFDVPDNAFLALELVEGALKKIKGIVEYPKPFYDTL